jgi:hypothetical protein
MIDELEPPMPWAEDAEADARRRRAEIPYYEILWLLNEAMWREAWAWAKEEVAKKHPHWVRQWPELFREREAGTSHWGIKCKAHRSQSDWKHEGRLIDPLLIYRTYLVLNQISDVGAIIN